MTTTSPPKSNSAAPGRRTPSSLPPTTTPLVTRGATARSAASPRLSTFNPATARRPPAKSASPIPIVNGESHEALSASLKLETDQKEQLLLRLQDKDQLISNYLTENNNLTSSLTAAETRLNELYAEQSRWEMDLAQRIDISEKLREQVRDLEKEKRDVQRRYNEQTATFDAERQAFYDNEQHLKSRIQSLTQARKRVEPITSPVDIEPDNDFVGDDILPSPTSSLPNGSVKKDLNDPENEPAEMTSLKLELSTLSTSYSSLQSTLMLMQTQLIDLKRVNQELQEENESYMILLREKTLSGQFDLMKQVGGVSGTSDDGSDDDREGTDVGSMLSLGRSTLDRVEEEGAEVLDSEVSEDMSEPGVSQSLRSSRHPSRPRRTSSHLPHGESLADLPITGPGLDLAAELGRAENKDILAENTIDDRDRPFPGTKGKRHKKGTEKLSHSESAGIESGASTSDIDALRTEVKSLKDANKALSLYASKIIDRIIAQEGFEHVLAIDYDKEPPTPSTATPHPNSSKSLPFSGTKARPQSVAIDRSSSNPNPSIDKTSKLSTKAQRRSLSFDWKGFSLFNTEKKPETPSHLRPLTLTPGATPVTSSARKLDNYEDEEDRKERERLHATMKLMGIQPAPSPSHPPPTYSYPSPGLDRSASLPSNAKSNRRFSLFGSRTPAENSDASSVHSTVSSSGRYDIRPGPLDLTQEALEHAEAENSLAALDAHERDLGAEIAKGSSGGFTEIAPRVGRRSRRSAGGSGSTVWSAGMSGTGDE
ncbi:hypothetical protein BYT27DRAFT_7223332 [Phlegmacium glaucopus]|nr:hypothetical protein BYT27DRAFT_7223332 [Phlegmacium glaucopus]